MDRFFAVMKFFRLVDEKNQLSLTNAAVIAATVLALTRPELQIADLIMFATSLASYQAKRWMEPEVLPASDFDALRASVESLQTKVSALMLTKK